MNRLLTPKLSLETGYYCNTKTPPFIQLCSNGLRKIWDLPRGTKTIQLEAFAEPGRDRVEVFPQRFSLWAEGEDWELTLDAADYIKDQLFDSPVWYVKLYYWEEPK